ncbi:translocase [Thalassococcus sp. BH17M4-6]|uniref:translocase n=1 Tax=Thalassococcus sp. BH17M4-6 TaxID=3413148 RepID=UPI003BD3597B
MQYEKTKKLAAGALCCAIGIGYVMQFGLGLPGQSSAVAPASLTVTSITPTSAAAVPKLPQDRSAVEPLPDAKIERAAVESAPVEAMDLPQDKTGGGFDCEVTLNASPVAGAMVTLDLAAPCMGSERVTFHHNGLMFTEVTQPDGTLQISVPAMSEQAMFIASFDNGDGAVAQANVTSLPFYDRVAVQWKGQSGLQLHAREFSADYFTDGHVWAAAAGDVAQAAQGKGGFLTELGDDASPEALQAEIYSFPAGTTRQSGDITITVEAEITQANCNSDVEAQTLELHQGANLRVRDLTLAMPECDTVGDFLVLKNLLEDLTIAAN